jgi:hypothetical protein
MHHAPPTSTPSKGLIGQPTTFLMTPTLADAPRSSDSLAPLAASPLPSVA